MSGNWEIFHTMIEGQAAFVYFDAGIGQTINTAHMPYLVKFQMTFSSPGANGMPGDGELAALEAVEEEIESWSSDMGGAYVGRVTGSGLRTFICYSACEEEDAIAMAQHLELMSGYEIGFEFCEDSAKSMYWHGLCPTLEERDQMGSMRIIEQLRACNDNMNETGHIDHFAYFDSRQQTEMFASWARRNGLSIDQLMSPNQDNSQHVVVFHQNCRALPEDMSSLAIAVSDNANRLGGSYGGWSAPEHNQAS